MRAGSHRRSFARHSGRSARSGGLVADAAALVQELGQARTISRGFRGFCATKRRVCSGAPAPTTKAGATPAWAGTISVSAAIAALSANAAGNAKAAPIVQERVIVGTQDLQQDLSTKIRAPCQGAASMLLWMR